MSTVTRMPRSFDYLQFCIVLALGGISVACSSPDSRSASSLMLQALAPVTLSETDSAFVGEPSGFAVLKDGSFAVSDRRNAVLHHFAVSGARIRGIGRRGEGPNEWNSGPTLAVAGGSLVFVGDGPSIRAVEVSSGQFLWSRRRTARNIATSSIDEGLMLSDLDPTNGSSVRLIAGEADSGVRGGPVPGLARANPIVAAYFSHPAATFIAPDTLALVLQSADFLYFGRFPSGPFDSLSLTPVERRGSLSAELARIDPANPSAGQRLIYRPSYPQIIRALHGGRYVAVVFSDLEMVSGRMTGRLFIEIIDWRARRRCAESPIDAPADPLPYVDLREDTLFVLSQRLDSLGGSITEIRRFRVNAEACAWSPVDSQ